jgi:MYXO-CTERM domain-containing protein
VVSPLWKLQCFGFGLVTCALAPSAAWATYSIAGVDLGTQEVGGAITSCVGTLDVGIVYGSLPGVGVVHAQAQLDQRGRGKSRALELLMQGTPPEQIITEITQPDFDQAFASRQYGVVDLTGRAAGFTGAQAQAYKNDQQGMSGSFVYSVQGNILTSQAVLDQAVGGFEQPACDLAERLMRALEAGADNEEGDSRCTRNGIPSDSAFIQVDRPGQTEPYLQLSIAGTGPESPLPTLRAMFDAWRTTHPCSAAGSGGPAAGSGGAGVAGATAPTTGATAGATAATAGATGAIAGATAATAGATAATAGATAATAGATAATAGATGATAGATGATAGATAATAGATAATPGATATAAATSGRAAISGSPPTTTAGAQPTAAANSGNASSPSTSGVGCAISAQPTSNPAYALLAAAALLLTRRRRKPGPITQALHSQR